jgi:NodT family efflux transporter outer membrane factor (OMF) lipoprotein
MQSTIKHSLIINRMANYSMPIVGILILGGCAQLPAYEKPAEIRRLDQLGSEKSFSSTAITWPQEQWWQACGDAQLDALIGEALRDSPSFAVARVRLSQADAIVQMSGAARQPQVSANLSVTEQKQSYNFLTPAAATPQGWKDYGRATLDFSWEMDFWGKNSAALAAATSDMEAARAEVAQARLLLATSVASAYVELAHLFTARDTAEAALDVRAKTAELFRQRYKFGLETLGGVRQMEARLAGEEAQLLAIDERIALQRNALAALMGAGPDRGLAIVRPTLNLSQPSGLPPQLALELLGRRPDIVAARLRAEAAAKRVEQRKAEFYPNINLTAFVGYQSLGLDKLTQSGSDIGGVGPAISLPIFNTNRLQGQLRGARAEYDIAVSSYNEVLLNALREVSDVAVSQQSLDKQLQALRSSVDAAKDAHQIANNRYQGGLSNYLDVLIAEDSLLASQRALTDMESRSYVLDVALVRALGGGYQVSKVATDEIGGESK